MLQDASLTTFDRRRPQKWRRPKNEDGRKNEDDLKNEDDIKKEDDLKRKKNIKNGPPSKNFFDPRPSLKRLPDIFFDDFFSWRPHHNWS